MRKSIYISIIVVSVILGLMISIQFRFVNAGETVSSMGREQELATERRQLTREIELLLVESNDLQGKIEEASKGHSEAEGAMYSEFIKINGIAGLTDLRGPGVTVVLSPQPDEDPRSGMYSIKDADLLKIINDLRGAGAEAIAVNQQRILATSEVRESGRHINVNLVRLAPPYTLCAIGNASMLKSSLEIKYGIIEDLQGRGISVSVEEGEDVFVPAFSGAIHFDFAKPTQGGG